MIYLINVLFMKDLSDKEIFRKIDDVMRIN